MEMKAREVVEGLSLGEVKEFSTISGGYSGSAIFRVKMDTHDLVVKFPAKQGSATAPEERVYGSDSQNFLPAYNLLKEKGLPLPALYTSGTLGGDEYVVMDFLEGVSVREHLADSDTASEVSLHKKVGRLFGEIHTITRPHFGNIEETHNDRFIDVFTEAFEVELNKVKEFVDASIYAQIESFVKDHLPHLDEPKQFVLSHLDGFQGIAKDDGVVIIDIEDHQFTDQRFVLAGHELSLEIEGKQIPESFWNAYKAETSVPENYFETKSLFQLYYLIVWMRVVDDGGKRKVLNGINIVLERESH